MVDSSDINAGPEGQIPLAERKAADEEMIVQYATGIVEMLSRDMPEPDGSAPDKAEKFVKILPVANDIYESSLTLKLLHNARVKDEIEAYRHFSRIATLLVLRDVSQGADKEMARQEEKMGDVVDLLDFCLKYHLKTADSTLHLLGRFESMKDPHIEYVKDMLTKSRKIFLEKQEACKMTGVFKKGKAAEGKP